jgi:5-methylthioadenosine/S-adenosylhomocysteine deaminase
MGMRGMIGEVLYDFDSPNYGKLENGFSYMDDLFSRFQDSKTVSISVDPHAIYTCSANLLIRLKEYAAKKNVPYVIHLAETKFEVSECLQNNGSTPVAYLDHLGVLDSSVIAAHCVELTSADVEMMAATGVAVAHCPESNMKLASGIAPVVDLLKAGISVGLGTDGAASNNDVDLFCEMDMAAKLQKVDHLNSAVMDAQTTLNMATLGGAHVLGMQSEIGSLVAGKKADLIMVEMNKPHLTPMYNPVSHLVYSVNGGDVLHSIIDGKVVMEDRVLTMIDEQQILAACRISAEKLTGRNC